MQGRLSPMINGRIQAFPWTHWKDEFPVAEQVGIHLMEWTLDQDRLYENPLLTEIGQAEIRGLCQRHNLSIPSLTGDCFMQAPLWKASGDMRASLERDFHEIAKSCAAVGISMIVIPLVDNGRLENTEQEDTLVAFLESQSAFLASHDLKVVFESDFAPVELARFISRLDTALFGINYDIGNSAALGFNPADEIAAYGANIVNVHVKDRVLGGTTVPLGTGNADFKIVFELLEKIKYLGNYILQTARSATGMHLEELLLNKTKLTKWLSQAECGSNKNLTSVRTSGYMKNTLVELHKPILMDNSQLRKSNENIGLHFKASESEMQGYPKINNLIVDTNYVEWVSCPSCGCEHTYQLLVKWGTQYDTCPVCSHVFAKNRLKQEILNGLYKDSISDELDRAVNQHSFNQQYWGKVYDKYLKYLVCKLGTKFKLLDVGCGLGLFITQCLKHGVENCHGLDVYEQLNSVLSPIVPANQIHQVESFNQASVPSDFDVLTMWGVLEHLTNPVEALKKSRDSLRQGGILMALVPNIGSRAFQILGVNTPTLNPRQHINFVTPKSMASICDHSGFRILEIVNELPVIDLMYEYIHYCDELVDEIVKLNESYYHVYILEKIDLM